MMDTVTVLKSFKFLSKNLFFCPNCSIYFLSSIVSIYMVLFYHSICCCIILSFSFCLPFFSVIKSWDAEEKMFCEFSIFSSHYITLHCLEQKKKQFWKQFFFILCAMSPVVDTWVRKDMTKSHDNKYLMLL